MEKQKLAHFILPALLAVLLVGVGARAVALYRLMQQRPAPEASASERASGWNVRTAGPGEPARGGGLPRRGPGLATRVVQTERHYRVTMQSHAAELSVVRVELRDGLLTVCGNWMGKAERNREGVSPSRRSFQQSFRLPGPVREDEATAEVVDGRLIIILPRKTVSLIRPDARPIPA